MVIEETTMMWDANDIPIVETPAILPNLCNLLSVNRATILGICVLNICNT